MKYKFTIKTDSEIDGHKEHLLYVHANDFYMANEDALTYIRQKLKYGEMSEETSKVLEELREILFLDIMA
jgi:hypothetical protein